eukprot:8169338-Pyramimonas_sp.AAC.1
MRDLQRIPSPHLRDDCPMLWKLRHRLQTAPPPEKNEARWGRDILGKALKLRGAPECVAELEWRTEGSAPRRRRVIQTEDLSMAWAQLTTD